MGILEIVNSVVQVIREGSFVEALRLLPMEVQRNFVIDEVNRQDSQDFAFRRLNDPSSNRGTAHSATGPSDLKIQAELMRIADQKQGTLPFFGL